MGTKTEKPLVNQATAMWWVVVTTAALVVSGCLSGGGGTPDGGSGTGSPVELASGQGGVNSIVLDDTSVYWIQLAAGTLMKMPKGGGPLVTLASPGERTSLAVDGTSVYWVTNPGQADGIGMLAKVPIGGGTPVMLASMQGTKMAGPAVDATGVYWFDDNPNPSTLMKVALGGGTPVTVATLTPGDDGSSAPAVDGTSVYWTSTYYPPGPGTPQLGRVMKVALGGGTPVMLASGLTNGAWEPNVDATSVYWATSDGVMKVPLGGGTPVMLVSWVEPIVPENSYTVDATSLYWTDGMAGTVMKVPLGGGTPVTLASGQYLPGPIAVDATSVYWGTAAGDDNPNARGSVMMLTPK